MKANTPDKIYLEAIYPDNGVLPNGLNYTPSPTDIEYILTDAFIEKACDWLKGNAYFYVNDFTGSLNEDVLIDEFRKYMKGE